MAWLKACLPLHSGLSRFSPPCSRAGVLSSAVSLLLKQAVERIARVRECALGHVRALLAHPHLRPHIPAADRVAAAAEDAAAAADAGGLTASLEALVRLVRLLDEPSYTPALFEGLVASIGGVDASLAKVASQALLDVLQQQGAPGESSPDRQRTPLLPRIAHTLVSTWSKHARSPRLATPLLRTALLLLTRAPGITAATLPIPPPQQVSTATTETHTQPPAESTFVDHLVELVRAETRACTDVARLCDAASVLAHLAPLPYTISAHARTSALQGLFVLLCSRYPKVRRHAAEQLYVQLLAVEAQDGMDGDGAAGDALRLERNAEAVCDLLLVTAWDGDLEAAKAARDEIAALVGVAVPKMKAPAAGAGGRGGAAGRDENASYQALLDDFARGY